MRNDALAPPKCCVYNLCLERNETEMHTIDSEGRAKVFITYDERSTKGPLELLHWLPLHFPNELPRLAATVLCGRSSALTPSRLSLHSLFMPPSMTFRKKADFSGPPLAEPAKINGASSSSWSNASWLL